LFLVATNTMSGPYDFGGFRFILPMQPTLMERGLETPIRGRFATIWRMIRDFVFTQLREVYEDQYVRFIAEHLPEDIGRLITARMIFL
jgi:hypothetical protein